MTSPKSSKSLVRRLASFFRRIFGRSARSLSRSGQIIEHLFDAARFQRDQRNHLQQLGYLCQQLFKEGKIQDPRIEKALKKLENNRNSQKKTQSALQRYLNKGDIRDVLEPAESDIAKKDIRQQSQEDV